MLGKVRTTEVSVRRGAEACNFFYGSVLFERGIKWRVASQWYGLRFVGETCLQGTMTPTNVYSILEILSLRQTKIVNVGIS